MGQRVWMAAMLLGCVADSTLEDPYGSAADQLYMAAEALPPEPRIDDEPPPANCAPFPNPGAAPFSGRSSLCERLTREYGVGPLHYDTDFFGQDINLRAWRFIQPAGTIRTVVAQLNAAIAANANDGNADLYSISSAELALLFLSEGGTLLLRKVLRESESPSFVNLDTEDELMQSVDSFFYLGLDRLLIQDYRDARFRYLYLPPFVNEYNCAVAECNLWRNQRPDYADVWRNMPNQCKQPPLTYARSAHITSQMTGCRIRTSTNELQQSMPAMTAMDFEASVYALAGTFALRRQLAVQGIGASAYRALSLERRYYWTTIFYNSANPLQRVDEARRGVSSPQSSGGLATRRWDEVTTDRGNAFSNAAIRTSTMVYTACLRFPNSGFSCQ